MSVFGDTALQQTSLFNVTVLRQATTPALFGNMKREIKARQDGGWKSVRWSMVKPPKLGHMDILHGRIMAQNPKVTCLWYCF